MLEEIKKYSGECGGTINTACKLITPLFLHIIYSTTLRVSQVQFGFIAILLTDECSHAKSSPLYHYLQ